MSTTMPASTFHSSSLGFVALALKIIESKPSGTTLRDYILTLRRNIKSSDDPKLGLIFDSGEYWRHKYRQCQRELLVEQNQLVKAKGELYTLKENDTTHHVRCVCGKDEEFGKMIACDNCDIWQHVSCMGLAASDQAGHPYFCEQCQPVAHWELIKAMEKGERPWELQGGSRALVSPSKSASKKRKTSSRDRAASKRKKLAESFDLTGITLSPRPPSHPAYVFKTAAALVSMQEAQKDVGGRTVEFAARLVASAAILAESLDLWIREERPTGVKPILDPRAHVFPRIAIRSFIIINQGMALLSRNVDESSRACLRSINYECTMFLSKVYKVALNSAPDPSSSTADAKAQFKVHEEFGKLVLNLFVSLLNSLAPGNAEHRLLFQTVFREFTKDIYLLAYPVENPALISADTTIPPEQRRECVSRYALPLFQYLVTLSSVFIDENARSSKTQKQNSRTKTKQATRIKTSKPTISCTIKIQQSLLQELLHRSAEEEDFEDVLQRAVRPATPLPRIPESGSSRAGFREKLLEFVGTQALVAAFTQLDQDS